MNISINVHLKTNSLASADKGSFTRWVGLHSDASNAKSDATLFLPEGTPPEHYEAVARAINDAIAAAREATQPKTQEIAA